MSDHVTMLLDQGILMKRNGLYEDAYRMYQCARFENPEDPRPYSNSAKMLLGMQQYDLALRNYLISFTHQIIKRKKQTVPTSPFPGMDPMQASALVEQMTFNEDLERFISKELMIDQVNFGREKLLEIVYRKEFTKNIIIGASNFAFYIGHAVIRQRPDLIREFSISEEMLRNLESTLLGKPAGPILRFTDSENIFLVLALLFVDLNYTEEFVSLTEAAGFYLDDANIRSLNYNFSAF